MVVCNVDVLRLVTYCTRLLPMNCVFKGKGLYSKDELLFIFKGGGGGGGWVYWHINEVWKSEELGTPTSRKKLLRI